MSIKEVVYKIVKQKFMTARGLVECYGVVKDGLPVKEFDSLIEARRYVEESLK